MTELQTTAVIDSPFTKVNKGLEIVGNWPKHLRALADGTAQEELRCAAYYYMNKKTPTLYSEIMTDDVTDIVISLVGIIQKLVNEVTGLSGCVMVE